MELQALNLPATDVLSGTGNDHYVIVSNPTTSPFFGWIPTSISFPKGERKSLDGFGSPNRPYDWHVIKYWDDDSIAIAQIKLPFHLSPGEVTGEKLGEVTAPPVSWAWHPDLAANVDKLRFGTKVTVTVGGQKYYALPLLMSQVKITRERPSTICFRTRSRFFGGGFPTKSHPLTLTCYWQVETMNPVVQVTMHIGNDTREMPVGQIDIQSWDLETGPGSTHSILQQVSYQGSPGVTLADAQGMAFKVAITMSDEPIFKQTVAARGDCEFLGLDTYKNFQLSKAMLTHSPIPTPRFGTNKILEVKELVDSQSDPVASAPRGYLQMINFFPGSTGAQNDFCSTLPNFIQQAMQSYSVKLLSKIFVACYRESYRGSLYFETREGVEDRVSLLNYPTLFFWGGKVHYYKGWNGEYAAEWETRCGTNTPTPFDPGDNGGWFPYDNQHAGMNHSRAIYELSGDPYLEDLHFGMVSVTYWSFFGPKYKDPEAERCARMLKEGYALGSLFRTTPEGKELLRAYEERSKVNDQAVTGYITKYGSPCVAATDACDPRINGGIWCPLQVPPTSPIVGGAWQTGFHMENECLRAVPDLRYLEQVQKFFRPDGEPVTYFVLPNAELFQTGGIGVSWWSGWVRLAQQYPQAPGSQFILEKVKPLLDADIQSIVHGYFGFNDSWKAWET